MQIIDINGKLVLDKKHNKNAPIPKSFELGTYFIKVTSEQNNKTNSYKIIKNEKTSNIINFCNILANVRATARCFNYQATIRAESGDLLVNTNVTFKVTIYEGQGVGNTYVESHFVSTDDLGHVNFVVGYGEPLEGSMAEIDWSMGNYWMKNWIPDKAMSIWEISYWRCSIRIICSGIRR